MSKVMVSRAFGGKVESVMPLLRRMSMLAAAGFLTVGPAMAQDRPLSLADAVAMARQRNGTIRAAAYNVEAAKSRVRQSFAAFLPTLTPAYHFDYRRNRTFTGAFRGADSESDDHVSEITARWLLLDSGEREWSYQATRRLAEATAANALQTLRNVLFTVYQQFYDTLRAQEFVRVTGTQVDRAEKILDQTKAQIEVGDAPRKDLLQAQADYLNAKVEKLSAENDASTLRASLKATVGLDGQEELADLRSESEPSAFPEPPPLQQAVNMGLANRPDLVALRKQREAQQYNVRTADRQAGFTWTLDASYNRGFSPDVSDASALTFLVTVPLFDGKRSKEIARQEKLNLMSQEAELQQAEREAKADIEAAHYSLRQNVQRVQAAKAAREAAQLNYAAALESQRLGAEGTSIITVATAQVSLVTAELNFVRALYDYAISDVRLKLVTGQTIPGENP
jgi:outer membrane protein